RARRRAGQGLMPRPSTAPGSSGAGGFLVVASASVRRPGQLAKAAEHGGVGGRCLGQRSVVIEKVPADGVEFIRCVHPADLEVKVTVGAGGNEAEVALHLLHMLRRLETAL